VKVKLVRITTVPESLNSLIKGQPKFMQEQGFEVKLASAGGKEITLIEKETGIKVDTFPYTRTISPIIDLRALWLTYNYFKKEKPHIVHTHTPKAGTIGMLAAWLARIPVRLHTVAGLPLLETKGLKRKLLDKVEQITYASANMVYPNSVRLKEIILKNGYCKASKVKVIGNGSSNGIDTNWFSRKNISTGEQEKVRSKYQINPDDFVFIFIGRLVNAKGITELAEAFAMLYKTRSKLKLLLVGYEEPELDPLDDHTRETIQNHPAIKLTGYQEDVRPFLAVSHALAFPSYREGFPNVPMQAGAMDLPSIVTDINGCNEIISNEHNGLIIPPKDSEALFSAMKRLVDEPVFCKQLAANARESIISRFDQQTFWKLLKDEYDEQLKQVKSV